MADTTATSTQPVANVQHVAAAVPTWLAQASAEQRTRYNLLAEQSLESQVAVQRLCSRFEAADTFIETRLAVALVDQSYWVLYLQKVFDMQFKALNAAWDDAMLLFDEATDPLEPFSFSGSRLTEAQAKLQALDPATQWEGVPRKITLDSQGKVQTYKLIMKGREDAQQALVLKLSNEQVVAAPR